MTYEIELVNPLKAKTKKSAEEFKKETERKIVLGKGKANTIDQRDVEAMERDIPNLSDNFRVWNKKVRSIFKRYGVEEPDFLKGCLDELKEDGVLCLKLKPETISSLISVDAVADSFGWQAIHLRYFVDGKKLIEFVKNNPERCLEEHLSFE